MPLGHRSETCPVVALQAWLRDAEIDEGPIFRGVDRHGNVRPTALTDRAVATIVQRAAESVGLDPRRFAGHSLRAGLATSAAKAGKSERSIARQTGHRSLAVLRRYIHDGTLWEENAADGLL